MQITTSHIDGSTSVARLAPADLVRFERHFGKGFGEVAASPSIEQIMWLAWTSNRRTKTTDLDFDDWMDTVEEVGEEATPLAPQNG